MSAVEFCGIKLTHPVINASGTFDVVAAERVFGSAVFADFPFSAYVSKTVTVKPRQGNPPPRLWEAPAGLINSIGLPNKGLEGFIANDLPTLERLSVPLIINVMGGSYDELALLVDSFAKLESVAALELNVSCPNVKTGLLIGADPDGLHRLLTQLRPLTDKPLIVKLTPNVTDISLTAQAATEGGASALSLINTLRGMALRPGTNQPWLGGVTGGVSGPGVRAVALAGLQQILTVSNLPVVAMGGIQSAEHARDFLRLGAKLVAIGTESFRDPLIAKKIAECL